MMIIDDREHESLKYHDWGFEHRVARMKVSDYVICEKLYPEDSGVEGLEVGRYIATGHITGVEAKEINDFVGSIEQRLWEQVRNMEDNFDTSVLAVYGTIGDLNHRNMEPRKIEGIYGALARISISYNVNVIWVREKTQYIKFIKKLNDKGGTKRSAEKAHLTKRNFRDDRVDVLYGIHGIGYKKIKNILDEFGSIRAVANATPQELMKVDGIGKKNAKKIHDIMNDGEKSTLL